MNHKYILLSSSLGKIWLTSGDYTLLHSGRPTPSDRDVATSKESLGHESFFSLKECWQSIESSQLQIDLGMVYCGGKGFVKSRESFVTIVRMCLCTKCLDSFWYEI